MVLTTFENQWGPLEAPYMSSMSHTSGIDPTDGSSTLEFEESPSNDNVGGVCYEPTTNKWRITRQDKLY